MTKFGAKNADYHQIYAISVQVWRVRAARNHWGNEQLQFNCWPKARQKGLNTFQGYLIQSRLAVHNNEWQYRKEGDVSSAHTLPCGVSRVRQDGVGCVGRRGKQAWALKVDPPGTTCRW